MHADNKPFKAHPQQSLIVSASFTYNDRDTGEKKRSYATMGVATPQEDGTYDVKVRMTLGTTRTGQYGEYRLLTGGTKSKSALAFMNGVADSNSEEETTSSMAGTAKQFSFFLRPPRESEARALKLEMHQPPHPEWVKPEESRPKFSKAPEMGSQGDDDDLPF